LLKRLRDQLITNSIYLKMSEYFQYFIYYCWNQQIQLYFYRIFFISINRKKNSLKSKKFYNRKVRNILSNRKNILSLKTLENLLRIWNTVNIVCSNSVKRDQRNKQLFFYNIGKNNLFRNYINQKTQKRRIGKKTW